MCPIKTMRMALLATAAAAGCATLTAATNTVHNYTCNGMTPVQQLVAAVTNAAANDVVLIEPGTYTFTGSEYGQIASDGVTNLLYVGVKNLTIMGKTDTSRKDWQTGEEPVVLNANGKGRLFYFGKSVGEVRNVAITGCAPPGSKNYSVATGGWTSTYDAVFTNCVLRGNDSSGEKYLALYTRFVDCCFTNNSTWCRSEVYECDFIDNTCAFQFMSAYGCTFRNNNGEKDLFLACPLMSKCRFVENTSTRCLLQTKDIDMAIEDCEFTDNAVPVCGSFANAAGKTNDVRIARCVFTRNRTALLGCEYGGGNPLNGRLTVTNCQFVANVPQKKLAVPTTSEYESYWRPYVLVEGRSDDIDHCVMYDSKFIDTKAPKISTGVLGLLTAYAVRAVRCTFSSDAAAVEDHTPEWNYENVAAVNSTLEECDISTGEIRNCVVDRCNIHDITNKTFCVFKDRVFVTNTLVSCCANWGGLYYAYSALDADFVNCTIVSNDMPTIDFWKVGVTTTSTNACRFLNCLFNGNSNPYGPTVSDISLSDNSANAQTLFAEYVDFTTSYYGVFQPYWKLTQTVFDAKATDGHLMQCGNPKFADEPKWSLSTRSPLRGKGTVQEWMETATDLIGNPRLRDDEVDVGCLQCWLNPPGFLFVVR